MAKESVNYYSVVQYVPDPIRDERMNIGVIVMDKEGIVLAARFPGKSSRVWSRAKRFGDDDLAFMRDFATSVERQASAQMSLFEHLEVEGIGRLEKLTEEWQNSIQFCKPKASILGADALMEQVYEKLVREPPSRPRKFRDKRAIVNSALRAVRGHLEQRFSKADVAGIVKARHPVNGKYYTHEMDIVVGNGRPTLAAEGLSFEVPSSDDLRREMDALYWAVYDLRDAPRAIKTISVLMLPPKRPKQDYEKAKEVYKRLGAEVVTEPDVAAWAEDVASSIKGSSRGRRLAR